jgi:hypothetical protein
MTLRRMGRPTAREACRLLAACARLATATWELLSGSRIVDVDCRRLPALALRRRWRVGRPEPEPAEGGGLILCAGGDALNIPNRNNRLLAMLPGADLELPGRRSDGWLTQRRAPHFMTMSPHAPR